MLVKIGDVTFVKIGHHLLNPANISYMEQIGEQFRVHMINNENAPLNFSGAAFGDSSYADMQAWLKQPSPELATRP